ncbi:hypothetical protein [Vibrio mangrovi]|uniref:Putative NAD(P)H nitroreductase acg n=1 Tax=Vibrio mangrovi TaxID=474394 RepID=A0A1Y6IND5_9VIBR|nr:hypothetical protein [Vibrio mangrovi]MDW6004027.1 hypothetical protein [Vibrio mangrovi]SMR99175.1 Putative NAD(P)H nitroreductase acg [Vibrio mangrovi]
MSTQSFEQKLTDAIEVARSAPSSHNCQPWAIHYSSSRMGCLAIDRNRALKGLPSLENEMLMSCGIFFQHIQALMQNAGVPLNWAWYDESHTATLPLPSHQEGLLCFYPEEPGMENPEAYRELSGLIQNRHTNRMPYETTELSALQQSRLQEIVTDSPVQLELWQDEASRKKVAALVYRYAALDFADKRAWQETYSFIHFDKNKPVDDGFFLHHLFGKLPSYAEWLFRIGFHPGLNPLTRLLRLPQLMARGFSKLVEQGPQYLALSVPEPNRHNLFLTGMTLAQLWLTLQQWGWSVHPLSVLVQHDLPKATLAKTLGMAHLPVFFARFGQIKVAAEVSPRRASSSILTID